MWKPIENDFFEDLKLSMKSMLERNHYIYQIIVALLFLPISIITLINMNHIIVTITCIILMILVGIWMIISIIQYMRWILLKQRLQENHALYHEAIILRKSNQTFDRASSVRPVYSVTVKLEHRKVLAWAMQDVYTQCHVGDKVYLVDLLGLEAKYNLACVAVRHIKRQGNTAPSDETLFFSSTTHNLKSRQSMHYQDDTASDYDTDCSVTEQEDDAHILPTKADIHPITDEERQIALRTENAKLRRIFIIFCLFIVLIGIVMPFSVIFFDNLGIILISGQALAGIGAIFVFSLWLFSYLAKIHYLKMLKQYPQIDTQQVLLTEKQSTSYQNSRHNINYYYYHCRKPDGTSFIIETENKSRAKSGDRILILYYPSSAIDNDQNHVTTEIAVYKVPFSS